jgi:DNA polymerase III subunit gamma/tau
MSFATLHRLWQMLLKGHDEVVRAYDPAEAADMAVLRVIHAATMPDPGELAKMLAGGVPATVAAPTAASQNTVPPSFSAMIDMIESSGKHLLAQRLRDEVGEISYAPPELVIRPSRPFDTRELGQVLKDCTGAVWTVRSEDAPAMPTLREQELAAENAARDAILAEPMVAAALQNFPGAELVSWEQERSANA